MGTIFIIYCSTAATSPVEISLTVRSFEWHVIRRFPSEWKKKIECWMLKFRHFNASLRNVYMYSILALLVGWLVGFWFFGLYFLQNPFSLEIWSLFTNIKKIIWCFIIPLCCCSVNPLCMWYDRNEEDYLYSMRKLQRRIRSLLNPTFFPEISHMCSLSIWLCNNLHNGLKISALKKDN